jgi:hypothetical protein
MAMTPLTGMPDRSQSQSTFDTNASSFFSTKLPLFVTEANALQTDVDAKRTLAETAATTATTQAGTATTQAGIATTQATLAANWATQLGTPVSGGEYSAKYHAQAAAASAASAVNSPGTQATSTDTMSISNASKSFMLQQTGKAFTVGQWVNITSSANPSTAWMAGAITAFNSGSGSMTVNVVMSVGAATLSSWVVAAASAFVESPTFGGRSVRTSNTILAGSDLGKLIDITSGTFTQTFTAAATLGGNWWCYIRNRGGGDITLDPNGGEFIDGLTSYIMYPGETRLVTCDGTGFYTIVLKSFYKVFTATGTFVWPPGYNRFQGLVWGGGGGGAAGYGGNGGSCAPFDLSAASLSNSTATVGAGGAVGGDAGASSIFSIDSGWASKGTGSGGQAGTFPYYRNSASGVIPPNRLMGGTNLAQPVYADYGGGTGSNAAGTLFSLTHSVYGGGGGVPSGIAGSSVFGGQGGVGAGNGTAPGGGGGDTGAGARGEIRIWGVI